MSSNVTASVVIPTHNRAAGLGALLDRVLVEAVAQDAEIVVVDNASTDDTGATIAAWTTRTGGRVQGVHEPVPGATRTRNRGARAARGTLVAFIDDDALPRSGWLPAILSPFREPAVAAVGGPVRLAFGEDGPPPWMTPVLAAYLAAYDLGSAPLDLATRPRHEAPRGLNMAFRRDALLGAGGFSLELGPRATRPSVGEESEICVRLRARGHAIRYQPAAVVDHVIDPTRLAPGWFLRRAFWTGWSEAVIDVRHESLRRIAGRLRWHYGADALGLRRGAERPDTLGAQCARREAWGYVLALARHLGPHRSAPAAAAS
jgi:glycosyltransferase involved in cell wall biosynthesis